MLQFDCLFEAIHTPSCWVKLVELFWVNFPVDVSLLVDGCWDGSLDVWACCVHSCCNRHTSRCSSSSRSFLVRSNVEFVWIQRCSRCCCAWTLLCWWRCCSRSLCSLAFLSFSACHLCFTLLYAPVFKCLYESSIVLPEVYRLLSI